MKNSQRPIVFIESLDEVEMLKNLTSPSQIKNLHIISSSIEADIALEHARINCTSIWKYIDTSDFPHLYDLTEELAEQWHRSAYPSKESSFLEKLLYSDFTNFFCSGLLSIITIRKMMSIYDPRTFLLLPIIRKSTPPKGEIGYFYDIFNRILHYCFMQKGIKREYLINQFQGQLQNDRSNFKWAAIRNRAYRYKMGLVDALRIKIDKIKHASQRCGGLRKDSQNFRILFFGWHWDFERQMGLDDFVNQCRFGNKYEIFHLYFGMKQKGGIYDDPHVVSFKDFTNVKPDLKEMRQEIQTKQKIFLDFQKNYKGC